MIKSGNLKLQTSFDTKSVKSLITDAFDLLSVSLDFY